MEEAMINYILQNEPAKLISSIENGADIHYKDDYPFILACSKVFVNIVTLLINLYNPNINAQNGFPLRMACIHGHMNIVICLVENGADINIDDGAALIWCAYKNKDDIAKYLIDKGANVYVRNSLLLNIYSNKGKHEMVNYCKKNDLVDLFLTSFIT